MTFDGVRTVVGFNVCNSSICVRFASFLLVDGAMECLVGVGLVSVDCIGVTFSELLDELNR